MKLVHYDDGKNNYQSHEIYLQDDIHENGFYVNDLYFESHDISDIRGYGENKEEALNDFKNKVLFLLKEYQALKGMLIESKTLENNMIEVDCCGKRINW